MVDKPTKKQIDYIQAICNDINVPAFEGKTKQEASEWLSKYVPLHNSWKQDMDEMNKLDMFFNWNNETVNG